jgi:aminopeptidase N
VDKSRDIFRFWKSEANFYAPAQRQGFFALRNAALEIRYRRRRANVLILAIFVQTNDMRFFFFLALFIPSAAYPQKFTHADSLRGNVNGSARSWWDLKHYELSVKFDEKKQEISGSNVISFVPAEGSTAEAKMMQIDLQEPMTIDSIVTPQGKIAALKKDGNAFFFPVSPQAGKITVWFHGKPRKAITPPWDGGVIWAVDGEGKPWITVACQGLGASVWFPCKDTQADEPDSVRMHFTCREDLACISNGRFEGEKKNADGTATFTWSVGNPINNYCMIPYIGDYVNIHEHYDGEKGMLDMDYWVLRGKEDLARKHFTDAPKTMEALEYWFGPYPFYSDGYKLVEAPHLGMEHQSAIAYGNGFRPGYYGADLSGTGVGLKWDFIIVHESGHEWFGNNITSKDIADMWVHEGFTCYSETLFTEYWFGKREASAYVIGLQKNIANDIPVIGKYGVNSEGSGDMYYKAANMLHTIRQIVHDDSLFRGMLRGLNERFYHSTVTTQEVESFMQHFLKTDLSAVFGQYLRRKDPPTLQLVYKKNKLKFRLKNPVKGLELPLYFDAAGVTVKTGKKWQKLSYPASSGVSEDQRMLYPNRNVYFIPEVKVTSPFAKMHGGKTQATALVDAQSKAAIGPVP